MTVGPRGVKVTAKGFRIGRGLSWRAILALGAEEGPEPPGRTSGAPAGEP
ncbi:hypothetical protein [Gemmatirosa kalamazoonensis]|nr:hypothetical protein [Gemmatirosa kalamazoonensis]